MDVNGGGGNNTDGCLGNGAVCRKGKCKLCYQRCKTRPGQTASVSFLAPWVTQDKLQTGGTLRFLETLEALALQTWAHFFYTSL